ncbi:MAG: hypothetical protein V2A73_15680 [Pseudomonadota bacterium]
MASTTTSTTTPKDEGRSASSAGSADENATKPDDAGPAGERAGDTEVEMVEGLAAERIIASGIGDPAPTAMTRGESSGGSAGSSQRGLPGERRPFDGPALRTIRPDAVGELRLGMPRAELARALGAAGRFRRQTANHGSATLETVVLPGRAHPRLLELHVLGGRLARIEVLAPDPETATDMGIRVGSSFADAIAAHGQLLPIRKTVQLQSQPPQQSQQQRSRLPRSSLSPLSQSPSLSELPPPTSNDTRLAASRAAEGWVVVGWSLEDLPGVILQTDNTDHVKFGSPPPTARISRILVVGPEMTTDD